MKKVFKIVIGTIVVLIVGLYLVFPIVVNKAGGDFNLEPVTYSSSTQKLIDSLFAEQDTIHDYHCHIVGIGCNQTGCFVNENMSKGKDWLESVKFKVYLSASGVTDMQQVDQQFLDRLVYLVKNMPTPYVAHILAFDRFYDQEGNLDLSKTTFYVPNNYVVDIAKKYPEIFEPCISIHPYRKDALLELEKFGKMGVKQVKWLPNAMGINPSDKRCIPFYQLMKEYDMTLLSHAGHEQAVHAEELQSFGNPLHLRKPLDLGVKVILAHCGTLGENVDLDTDDQTQMVSNYELFLRLMNDSRYDSLLRADISAISQYNRYEEGFQVLDKSDELKSRLVYGSDYPLPAINFLTHTSSIQKDNYISLEERNALDEIYKVNPLLFDVVLKKLIKSKAGNQFNYKVFLK